MILAKTTKNWDQVVKDSGIDDPKDGDEGLNELFQKIYGEGDDSTKRAMMKSYVS